MTDRERDLLLAVYGATVGRGGWLSVVPEQPHNPGGGADVEWVYPPATAWHHTDETMFCATVEEALTEAAKQLGVLVS